MAADLCLLLAWSALAADAYLTPDKPDGIQLLPPPPLPGSAEEAADLASAQAVFAARTPAEERQALKDAGLSPFLFTAAIGPAFEPGKLPKTEALFQQVKKEVGGIINRPKNHWKRLRPYELDARLLLGSREDSTSYPSGHSTRGTVYAWLFAELFPEKREAIQAIGRQIGWDRVLIGRHFPTDIYAGRVLGKAITSELAASSAFQRDLAEAKAEIEAQSKAQPQPQETVPAAQEALEAVPAK
jgi:acid phosphatase (class A)